MTPSLLRLASAAAFVPLLVAARAAAAPTSPPGNERVTLTPAVTRLATCGTVAFHAAWSGPPPIGAVSYAWSASGGTVDGQGRFRAASTPRNASVTARAITVDGRPLGASATDAFTVADAFPAIAASPLTVDVRDPIAAPPPARVIGPTELFQHQAAGRAGRAYFTWVEQRATDRWILAVRARDRSGEWHAPVLVPVGGDGSTFSHDPLAAATLAVDAGDENVIYLAYRTRTNAQNQWLTVSRDGGRTFSPPAMLGGAVATADIVSPKPGVIAMTLPSAGPSAGQLGYFIGDPAHLARSDVGVFTDGGYRFEYPHGTSHTAPRLATSMRPDARGNVRTCVVAQGEPSAAPHAEYGTYSMCTTTGAFPGRVVVTPIHVGTPAAKDGIPAAALGPRRGDVEPYVVTFVSADFASPTGDPLNVALSVDGGATWTLAPVQRAKGIAAGDVRFDEDGVLWLAYNVGAKLYVTKSCDFVGGVSHASAIHWSPPLLVAEDGARPSLVVSDRGVSVVAETPATTPTSQRSFAAWTLTP